MDTSQRTTHRVGRVAIAVGVGLLALLAGGPRVQAQTTIPPPQAITVTVNLNVATPAGVTGYRVDATCKNVPGTPTGDLSLSLPLARAGGTGQILMPLSSTVSCAFRVVVLGTGPRPLVGNAIVVGGVARPVSRPTIVDGVAVDLDTVIETAQIPVTAATTVLIGPDPATTTTSTTAAPVAPSTTTTTTTTTRPPTTTTPTTPVVVTAAPTTSKPLTVITKAVRKVLYKRVCVKVRNKRCVAYKTVRV